MSEQFEGHLRSEGDIELFYHFWRSDSPKATILVTHGQAEHSECYGEFAEKLNRAGYDVLAWDLRGHGRSEGKRGYVRNFSDYETDLVTIVAHARDKDLIAGGNLVMFGHSMGGLITLNTLLNHSWSEVKCCVLSAPALGLAVEVPKWKDQFAHVGAKWLPKMTLWNEIQFDQLIRDEEKIKEYASDPLRHDQISSSVYVGMVERFEKLKNSAGDFRLPLLLQVGGNDKIISSSSSIYFFDECNSVNKQLEIYEDSLHEVYNDLDNEHAFRDIIQYLNHMEFNK